VSGLKTQDVESQRITFDLSNKIYAKMSLLTLTLTILRASPKNERKKKSICCTVKQLEDSVRGYTKGKG